MSRNKMEVRDEKKRSISPNSFSIAIEECEGEGKSIFSMSFADMDVENHVVDVLTTIKLPAEGMKVIFRRMLDVIDEYRDRTGIDIFEDIINELEEKDKEGAGE